MPICSNCGSNVDQNANNCPQCGSSLSQQCPICGNQIQSDQRFCTGCGLQVINNESIVYSCSATSITGLASQDEGALKLTSYRIVFTSQNIPGNEGILQIPITKIKHLSKKASIAHASKGTYQITIKTSNPKGTFKFVANAGKNFVKYAKKVQRNPRIIPSPSTISTASPPKPTTNSSASNPLPLSHQQPPQANQTSSKMTWGLGILCFIIPLLGIYIWFTEREKHPKKAKAAILLTIYPTFMLFMMPSLSNQRTSSVSVSSEPIHTPTAPSTAFSIEEAYNDVYDVPIKTQVERHYVVSGEISYSELEDFLEDTYEEIISSTGYEYRDHPDAVYLYVYTPGTSSTNWIAMLDKSAGSSGPSILINLNPGEVIDTRESTSASSASTSSPENDTDSAAELEHANLLGEYAGDFEMEVYSEAEDCYFYFSDDNICWLEVYGSSDNLKKVFINTEPSSEAEISLAYDYQNQILSETVPSLVQQGWLDQAVSQWQSTQRTQTTWVGNTQVKFYMEHAGAGMMGLNTEIIF